MRVEPREDFFPDLRVAECGPIIDSVVRWELVNVAGRVRLTLTHKRLSPMEAIHHSAGWHAFVDRLSAVAGGNEPPDLMERFAQLLTEYEKQHDVSLTKER